MAISQTSNSLPRTMRRKPSMRTGTSTKSNAKVFGFTVPSLRAWLLPWVRVTVFNLSSAMGASLRLPFRSVCRTSRKRRARPSAAIAADTLGHQERFLQPSKWEIVTRHLAHRPEYLKLIALCILGPESHHGFQRWTARKTAGDFCYKDCGVLRKREALARPIPHTCERLAVFRTPLRKAKLCGSNSHHEHLTDQRRLGPWADTLIPPDWQHLPQSCGLSSIV